MTSASTGAKRGTEKGPVLGVDYAGKFPTSTAGLSCPTKPQHAISTLSSLSTTPSPWTNCCNGLNNRDDGAAAGYAPSVPLADDRALLSGINHGEFAINGFRNRDLRPRLFDDETTSRQEQRRHAAAVTRKLAMLRAHRLIRKLHGTHRYLLTKHGRVVVTALITARNANSNTLTKLAA